MAQTSLDSLDSFFARVKVRNADLTPRASHTSGASAAIPHRRILIADDNLDLADSLRMLLKLDGHRVTATYDGEHAIELARSLEPEFMLLDLAMPDVDGFEVAKQIRRHSWGRAIQLVAITGFGQAEYRTRALRAGFNHHLTKPVCMEDLRVILSCKGGRELAMSEHHA